MFIYAVIGVCLVLFHKQVRGIANAVLGVPTSLFHAGESLFRRLVLGNLEWLKTEVPKPLETVKGVIALAVAVLVSVTDFFVIQKTIRVIFPWHVAEVFIALSLVTLCGAMWCYWISRAQCQTMV